MEEQFSKIVDIDFTANMEKSLDEVEEGKESYTQVLDGFYGDFITTLETAEKNMEGTRVKVPDEETDVVCELCGRKMVIKTGGSANSSPARLPRVPQHQEDRQGDGWALPRVRRQGARQKVEERQGLLRLRALPRMQVHDVGQTALGALSQMRRGPLPEDGARRAHPLPQGGLRLRAAGEREVLCRGRGRGMTPVAVIGAGLAGCEAAWALANAGIPGAAPRNEAAKVFPRAPQ